MGLPGTTRAEARMGRRVRNRMVRVDDGCRLARDQPVTILSTWPPQDAIRGWRVSAIGGRAETVPAIWRARRAERVATKSVGLACPEVGKFELLAMKRLDVP